MQSHRSGAGAGSPETDDQPLSPSSVPEGPVAMVSGNRSWSEFSRPESLDTLTESDDLRLLDHLEVGVIVFDHDQNLRYANAEQARLLGVDIEESGDMEVWLRAGCRDGAYADRVIASWREHVWQKQLRRVFSLKNAEDKLREIEFRPKLLQNGDLLLTLLDVTDGRQAEDALRVMDAKFTAVLHQVSSGIALIDRTGRFLDVNDAFAKLLGYPRGELRRMSLADCVAFSDIERLRSAELSLASEEGTVGDPALFSCRHFSGEEAMRFRPREGDIFPAEITLSLARGPERQVLFTMLSVNAGGLSGGEENRALLEAIPDLIMVLNREGIVLDIMPADGASWRGARAGRDWIGKQVSDCWNAFDATAVTRIASSIDDGVVHSWRLPDESAQFSIRAAACGEDRAVVVVMDVSDEAEAREALARQGLAFRHLDEAILVTNLQGRITDCNEAAERIFGYSAAELAGQGLSMLYAASHQVEEFNAGISHALTEQGRWESQRTFYRKDGSTGRAEVSIFPVKESGQPRSLLGIHRELAGRSPESDPVGRMQHRWRNQLQTVASLLNLECLNTTGDHRGERELLLKVQSRLRAVSRLHECIRSLDAMVELGSYSRQLAEDQRRIVAGLRGDFENEVAWIDVQETVEEERVIADFETATVFGLYLTELMIAVLTAEPEGTEPGAAIVLRNFEGHPLMEADVPAEAMFSLSIPVLKILTEQLRGSLKVDRREGRAKWMLRFPSEH